MYTYITISPSKRCATIPHQYSHFLWFIVFEIINLNVLCFISNGLIAVNVWDMQWNDSNAIHFIIKCGAYLSVWPEMFRSLVDRWRAANDVTEVASKKNKHLTSHLGLHPILTREGIQLGQDRSLLHLNQHPLRKIKNKNNGTKNNYKISTVHIFQVHICYNESSYLSADVCWLMLMRSLTRSRYIISHQNIGNFANEISGGYSVSREGLRCESLRAQCVFLRLGSGDQRRSWVKSGGMLQLYC